MLDATTRGRPRVGDFYALLTLADDFKLEARNAKFTEVLSRVSDTVCFAAIVQHVASNAASLSLDRVPGWTSPELPFAVFVYTYLLVFDPQKHNPSRVAEAYEAYKSLRRVASHQNAIRLLWALDADLSRAFTSTRAVVESARFDVIDRMVADPLALTVLEPTFDWDAVANQKSRSARLYICGVAECGGTFSGDALACTDCGSEHCHECHCHKVSDAHVCTPTDVLTVRDIRTTTKACPRCSVPVYHSEGCDQMMCTWCRCMFMHSTGTTVSRNEAMHNPYYMELSQKQRESVRANMSVAAPADLAGKHFDDPLFEVAFNQSATHVFGTDAHYPSLDVILDKLRFWTRVYEKVTIARSKDEELANRQARMCFLLKHTMRANGKASVAFTTSDYEKGLRDSQSRRTLERQKVEHRERMCAAALELFLAIAKETRAERRTALFDQIQSLRIDEVPSPVKRKLSF